MKKSLQATDWKVGDQVLKEALNLRTRQLCADHYRQGEARLSPEDRDEIRKEIEALSRCIYVLDAAWMKDFEPGY